MSKELEEIKSIVAVHFAALGFLNPFENEQILKDRDRVLNALNELQSIKDAKPSEALKSLNKMFGYASLDEFSLEEVSEDYHRIEQVLLKAQEPKHYLKWEDLDFDFKDKYMKVKLNGNIYTLRYKRNTLMEFPYAVLEFDNTGITIIDCEKQFFNDLHLEVIE